MTEEQLRVYAYPDREFLIKDRQQTQTKSCRHCQVENEGCARIIAYCPVVQDAKIKRHNQLCDI